MDYISLEKYLSKKIDNAIINIIGVSELRRYIYSVCFDFSSKHTVIIHGAIHAREHITTDLIVKLIKDVSLNYSKYKEMGIPNIIFVPMVNPDGVELVCNGLKSVKDRRKRNELLKINGSDDFSLFKANANGVDLNTNFDAKWGCGEQNKLIPSASDYIGESPMSEYEVQALALLTINKKASFTISYHAKGQEIYYQFFNKKENLKRDRKIAKIIAKSLHYKIKNVQNESGGGYKDWCVYRLNIPAVTIEVGKDSLIHPIGLKNLKQIYSRNKGIIKLLKNITKEIDRNERNVYERSLKSSEKSSQER